MKRIIMAAAAGVALAGCSTGAGELLAGQNRTVEYVRVFDIKTEAPAPAVVHAASEGISRNIRNATLAAPLLDPAQVLDQPGRFKLAETPGAAAGPSCEGASWTAKARPDVRGSQDTHIVACLYPYKTGYHLDMYAAVTRKEGGWLAWPRHATGVVLGTPDKFVEKTMLDLVRTIRETTGAQVALVEAKPEVAGAPWLEPSGGGKQTSKP
jgi:hypothetical protein